MRSRNHWLHKTAGAVTVALQVRFFEIQRAIAQTWGLPQIREIHPTASAQSRSYDRRRICEPQLRQVFGQLTRRRRNRRADLPKWTNARRIGVEASHGDSALGRRLEHLVTRETAIHQAQVQSANLRRFACSFEWTWLS
jgi:hypothetical protein